MSEAKTGELEQRVKHLEERVKRLVEIADSEKKPFTFLVLENDLTHEQEKKILDLMGRVHNELHERKSKPMNYHEFEKALWEIVSSKDRDYHFAEDVVSTLNEEGRWTDVYEYMKKSGMNLD